MVATPAPLFAYIYIDTMHLPPSGGYKYIVQVHCSVSHYPEWCMLRTENEKTLGNWLFQDLLCRWGSLSEVITDNGPAFVKAAAYLAKKYHIRHIRISGYNSRANGIVEQPHFDVRQALFKSASGDESKWSQVAHYAFWSERITTRRRMGCSPYFAVTGCHPILPFDISEATYLLPPPDSILSTTDLLASRALALQKRQTDIATLRSDVYRSRLQAAQKFERDHAATLRDFDFKRGDLVLMRHTQIEKSLNRKMRPRYLGPLVVLSRNRGDAYILCELDGSVFHRPIAAFRLLPYLARKSLTLPDDFLDISDKRFEELKAADTPGDDDDHQEADEDEAPDFDAIVPTIP